MTILGILISEALEREGLTQSRASDLTGVSRSTISKIISGQSSPDPGTLELLGRALGINVTTLYEAAAADFLKSKMDDEEYQERLQRIVREAPRARLQRVIEKLHAEAENDPYLSTQLEELLRKRKQR